MTERFSALEHTVIADSVADRDRTATFACYSFVGAVFGAFGALGAGGVDGSGAAAITPHCHRRAVRATASGPPPPRCSIAACHPRRGWDGSPPAPLGPSRRRVYGPAVLFSVDAFGGGLVVNGSGALALRALRALGFHHRRDLLRNKLCSAVSYFLAVPLARRFGLVNTMVFTHLPANIFLMLTAFAPTIEVAFLLLVLNTSALRDGFPDAVVLRHGRGPAGGKAGRSERHRGAAQSCRRAGPLPSGWLVTLTRRGRRRWTLRARSRPLTTLCCFISSRR